MDQYLKTIWTSNDNRQRSSEVDAHGPHRSYSWGGDLIRVSSLKTKKRSMSWILRHALFFLCFQQTKTDQVIVLIVRTRKNMNFYFLNVMFVVFETSNYFKVPV